MNPSRASTDRRRLALVLLAAAQFVVVLDASIVNVALPSIGSDLRFSQDDLSWVVNAYVLVFGGFLLLGGRLADLLGRRRLFMAGLIVFAAASLAGGLAQTDVQLIAARAVQGLGAALLSPAALSLLTVLFAAGAERNKAMGVWGAVAGSGGAAGVLLGGMLTEWAGWEWVFFVNVPVGVVAAVLSPRLLPESRIEGRRRFDVAGAASITAGLTMLVYAVVNVDEAGWLSAQTLTLAGVAAALIAAFVVVERRSSAPLVSFRIFRLRTLTGANVVAALVAAAAWPMFLFVSLYMQQVLGFSAFEAGLAYLPLALGIMISAGLASRLVTRYGYRPVFVTGLTLTAAGMALFAQVDAGGTYTADVLPAALVVAAGLGMSFVAVTLAAVADVPDREAGLASGLVNASQQLGGALGIAVLASVASSATGDVLTPAALTSGFQDAFLVGAGIALAGAPAALAFLPRPERSAGDVPHVVVVGGGFGGLEAVRRLRRARVRVTLVDRRNFHLFMPLLYQVATGALSPGEIATPLRARFKRRRNVRVLLGEVTGFDLSGRRVEIRTSAGRAESVPYDTLIVAAGSRYTYHGRDEWAQHAPAVKTVDSALDVRRRILRAFEAAEAESDPERRAAWLSFVVVGGGPTGVELAGQVAEIARDTLRGNFRAIDPGESRVLLVEHGDRVLPSFPATLAGKAQAALRRLGVTPVLGRRVVDIDPHGVTMAADHGTSERIAARTVVWAAGVVGSPLAGELAAQSGAGLDGAGRLLVEPDLTLPGRPEVLAVGDMAAVRDREPYPGVAPVAMQQGRHAADVVRDRLGGRSTQPFRYHDKGNVATIGRGSAVADVRGVRLSGGPAWLFWLGLHLYYLMGFQNRLLVLLRWTAGYLTRGRGARLITGEDAFGRGEMAS